MRKQTRVVRQHHSDYGLLHHFTNTIAYFLLSRRHGGHGGVEHATRFLRVLHASVRNKSNTNGETVYYCILPPGMRDIAKLGTHTVKKYRRDAMLASPSCMECSEFAKTSIRERRESVCGRNVNQSPRREHRVSTRGRWETEAIPFTV